MSSGLAAVGGVQTVAPQGGVSRALPCRFLGTSGQNVSDIFRYSSMEDHLEILEWTLQVRHVSPTAPDTLGTGTQTRGVQQRAGEGQRGSCHARRVPSLDLHPPA